MTLGASHGYQRREAPKAERYVGIDLHRRRSVIYAMNGDRTKLARIRIDNVPVAPARAVADAVDGHDAEVVIESVTAGPR